MHAGKRESPRNTRHDRGVLRVLMTADAVGGIWPYTLDLTAALSRRGVQVTIAVMGPAPTIAQRSAAAAIATLAIGDYRLEWMDDPWDDVGRAGEWLLDLEGSIRPDVVHLNGYCHASLPWDSPVIVVAHSCVCSWWRSVHGSDTPSRLDRYRLEVSRGLASARLVIAPTAAMLAALHREYDEVPEARIIPNGRPAGAAVPGPGRPHGEGATLKKEPLVFAAGRLWDEAKNIQSLSAISPSLSWPVYVAGSDTAPDGRCDAPAGTVRYLGRLDRDEMEGWFARAAIYALPARYEPFGLSVLEAAASGCALVLGDIPSLRENWSGRAIFVPPDNRRALAGALQRLIDAPEERERLAGLGRERAMQFGVDAMAERYLAAYRDAAAACRPDVDGRSSPRVPGGIGLPGRSETAHERGRMPPQVAT